MKMDYDECRAKISIIDIAEDLGYTRISGRQATNLTYVLGTPKIVCTLNADLVCKVKDMFDIENVPSLQNQKIYSSPL